MESRIRATKRELAGFDEGIEAAETDELRNALRVDFNGASVRLKKQEAILKEFLRKTGLQNDPPRVQTRGFSRSQAQKAVHAVKRNKERQEYIKNIKPQSPKVLAVENTKLKDTGQIPVSGQYRYYTQRAANSNKCTSLPVTIHPQISAWRNSYRRNMGERTGNGKRKPV